MSQVLWAKSLKPGANVPAENYRSEYHPQAPVPLRIKRWPAETGGIPLPDPRVVRSVSRAAVLMLSLCLEAKDRLAEQLAADPYSVGIYAAVENGPVDFPSLLKIYQAPPKSFAENYRAFRNPKMYLKQLPNLAAAQLGIFLGVRGPMNVYTHSTLAGGQALRQADSDLNAGEVKMALVCTGTGFEDPLAVVRAGREAGTRVLCEGAAAILLAPNGRRQNWKNESNPIAEEYYGIGDEIFQFESQIGRS